MAGSPANPCLRRWVATADRYMSTLSRVSGGRYKKGTLPPVGIGEARPDLIVFVQGDRGAESGTPGRACLPAGISRP